MSLFHHATDGGSAFPYQRRLAAEGATTSLLLNVPTGLGKTAATVLSWIWRRRFSSEKVRAETPRRLVYCLPMRVLTEQTFSETVRWLDRLGLLAGQAAWETLGDDGLPTRAARLCDYAPDEADPREPDWAAGNGVRGSGRIAVHLLMGGEERTDWALWPERDAVLVGTQDMLLSRALNRGYASRRPHWPIEFGLLNNDCLWVFDEVQLMGPGLATGLQLEAFRNVAINGKTYLGTEKRCVSWYLSATASRRMLVTRDWRAGEGDARPSDFVFELSPEERSDTAGVLGRRRLATKTLEARLPWKFDDETAAERILTRHREMVSKLGGAPSGVPRRTLLICNTVGRAGKIYAAICQALKAVGGRTTADLVLLHSRYRPADRARQQERLKANVPPDVGQIVVATQVVEAGVDLSSAILWTEIAPLPSIVQRLGRLNRAGEFGHNGDCLHGWTPVAVVVGIPLPAPQERAPKEARERHERETINAYLPYDRCECEAAQTALANFIDVSPANLEIRLRPELDAVLRPPNSSLQRHELLDFFDTDSNLSLGYTDVSPFVRGIDPETDIGVVWREWEGDPPPFGFDIGRQEICQVPIRQVVGKNGLSSWGRGFVWLGRERGWQQASRDNLLPGGTLLLPIAAGGYVDALGWTGNSADVGQISDLNVPFEYPTDEDLLSGLDRGWQSVDSHTRDVRAVSNVILDGLSPVEDDVRAAITEAILWHDYGKVVGGWQEATRQVAEAARLVWPSEVAPVGKFSFRESPLLAGLAGSALRREVWRLKCSFAPRLRHEVASALALRQHHRNGRPEPTIYQLLAQFLVMSHHGHVRKTLRDELPPDPSRLGRDGETVRGIREGASVDAVSIAGQDLPATSALSIACRRMGRGADGEESWTRSVLRLLGHFGPFRLAYFEALVRAADRRASANPDTGIINAKPCSPPANPGIASGEAG